MIPHQSRPRANNPLSLTSVAAMTADLRSFAHENLPAAMVPTRFVILDTLPKLPNGKVDRKRLPTEDASEQADAKFIPPTTPEELRIAQIWRDLLGISRIGVEDSFFDLGGDSLTAVQMAAKVREEYGVALSLRRLFKDPTVAALARMVRATGDTPVTGGLINLTDDELLTEARLSSDITPAVGILPPATTPYRSILLTGGTGYTGAFLLRELLDRSDARIYVLARAYDSTDAVNRVRNNLQTYGLWRDGDLPRLKGVAGDIGRPYFALNRNVYDELTEHVEMIVHNAALSSYAMPYKQLKPTNVLGTLEVLRLATRHRLKPVHYISSLAVFPGHRGIYRFDEGELGEPNGLVGGYRQSKWVADRLVSLAGHRGLPVCIYRPGQITGAQTTGACSPDTFLNAAIKGCVQLGAELDFDVMLEITPVDFCAAAVAHIALSGSRHGTQFHLAGTRPVSWAEVTKMLRAYGYSLRPESYPAWYRALASAMERGADNALSKFFPLFGEETPSADAGDEGSRPFFGNQNLQAALAGSEIACRTLDQSLMSLYLDYFVSIGFLPAPCRGET